MNLRTNPAYSFDGQQAGDTMIMSTEGGFAKYRGVEASYQRQFTLVPGL